MKKNDSSRIIDLAIVGFCAVTLLFSVRANSIWIDEGQTYSVICGTWQHMLRAVFGRGDAVSGMPLYFIAEFFWCSLFGYGEYALRSMNLVFAALSLWCGCKMVRAFRLPMWVLPLFAVNPVFLYYMNEARPYAAIYTCGMWCLYFLFGHQEEMRRKDMVGFAICFWLGCALHMMFVFMGMTYLCRTIMLHRTRHLEIRDHAFSWLAITPFFVPLAIHYFNFTFNAPEVQSQSAAPLSSIAQIVYYFAGLGGLGPSRNALRGMNIVFTPRIFIELAAAAVAYIAICVYFARLKLFKIRILTAICISLALALSSFALVNIVMKTRFWERHVIYIVPGISLALAFMIAEIATGSKSRSAKVMSALVLAIQVVSGLNIISMEYYQKDNHKGAAKLARSFNPDHIFFQGDAITFSYYGLKGRRAENVQNSEEAIQNVNISNISQSTLEKLVKLAPGRIVLILNEKPEFDAENLHRRMGKHGVAVNSFIVVPFPENSMESAS